MDNGYIFTPMKKNTENVKLRRKPTGGYLVTVHHQKVGSVQKVDHYSRGNWFHSELGPFERLFDTRREAVSNLLRRITTSAPSCSGSVDLG